MTRTRLDAACTRDGTTALEQFASPRAVRARNGRCSDRFYVSPNAGEARDGHSRYEDGRAKARFVSSRSKVTTSSDGAPRDASDSATKASGPRVEGKDDQFNLNAYS